MTTDVTPCQHDDDMSGSHPTWASRWECRSTKPGVTRRPSASITRPAPPASTVADRGDAVAVDGDVGPAGRRPGAVDDGAARDHQVVRHGAPRCSCVEEVCRDGRSGGPEPPDVGAGRRPDRPWPDPAPRPPGGAGLPSPPGAATSGPDTLVTLSVPVDRVGTGSVDTPTVRVPRGRFVRLAGGDAFRTPAAECYSATAPSTAVPSLLALRTRAGRTAPTILAPCPAVRWVVRERPARGRRSSVPVPTGMLNPPAPENHGNPDPLGPGVEEVPRTSRSCARRDLNPHVLSDTGT